jgi:hypothetical protein
LLAPSPLDEERCEKNGPSSSGFPPCGESLTLLSPKNVPATFTNGLKSPRPTPAYIVSGTFSDAAYIEEDEKMWSNWRPFSLPPVAERSERHSSFTTLAIHLTH